MATGFAGLRSCARLLLQESPLLTRSPVLRPTATQFRPQFRSFTSTPLVAAEPTIETIGADIEPPTFSTDVDSRTRLVPASASYFTGQAEFYDNWLALEDLLRKLQTLPTIPRDEAPKVRWKTLAQYRSIVGESVKAAKYRQIIHILDRLNCIEPSLLPEQAKAAMKLYEREGTVVTNQTKEKSLDRLGRAYGVGRRKTSVAKVWVLEGDGNILVNGKPITETFERLHDRESALWPLITTERMNKYNVWAIVEGGGKTGQAEAVTLGIARALLIHEPALKAALRSGKTSFLMRWERVTDMMQPVV